MIIVDGPAWTTMRFSHAVVRDVRYESMAPSRRITLHRGIARALERLPGADPDSVLAQVAHQPLLAAPGGDVDDAVAAVIRAGDAALHRYGYEDAVRLFASVVDRGGGATRTVGSALRAVARVG